MALVLPFSRRTIFVLVVLVSAVAALSCGDGKDEATPSVRLNELQFIGTHNSYHVQPPDAAIDAIALFEPDFAASIEFNHPPLRSQLDAGIRQVELDVYYDPEGGRYAKRIAAEFLGIPAPEGLSELRAPGFKVMRSPEADFYSTCWTLQSCLSEIAAWSDSNPGHLPLSIWLEPKDEPTRDPLNLGFVQPLPFDRNALTALEAEVLAVFSRNRLITPDTVRGNRQTLEEAVLQDGWPALDETRGKVMVVLLDESSKRAAYVSGAASLEGPAMFTTSAPGQPDAAVLKVDDARGAVERVQQLVRSGYLVRVMADAESVEVRKNDTSRRDTSFLSGSHYISTDYPDSVGIAAANGYAVRFPDGSLVRCNPITASAGCVPALGGLARR